MDVYEHKSMISIRGWNCYNKWSQKQIVAERKKRPFLKKKKTVKSLLCRKELVVIKVFVHWISVKIQVDSNTLKQFILVLAVLYEIYVIYKTTLCFGLACTKMCQYTQYILKTIPCVLVKDNSITLILPTLIKIFKNFPILSMQWFLFFTRQMGWFVFCDFTAEEIDFQ